MAKLSIFIVSGLLPPQVSGAGKRALRTAKEISKHHNVTLVSRTRNKSIGIPNVVVLPEFAFPKNTFGRSLNNILNLTVLPLAVLFQLIKLKKPDILHVYSVNWFSIFIVFYNNLIWKSKLFTELTLMGSDTINSTSRWWLYRKLTNYCIYKSDQINCLSPQLFDYMIELGFREERLSLIPNSLDEKFLNYQLESKEKQKTHYGFGPHEFLIITIGGITKRKGYLLIKEIIKLIPSNKPIKVIAIGSFELESQKKLLSEIQLDLEKDGKKNRLIFVGYTDPLPYLLMGDMFLFASTREGFPSAIIEAMACSLPVVVKKIDKVTDYIIKNNHNGIIVDSDNPADFVFEILNIFENKKSQSIEKTARKDVINRFSLHNITNKYLSEYNSLLAKV
jgi:glycosyltransferase involved in cell wall biosynthesis